MSLCGRAMPWTGFVNILEQGLTLGEPCWGGKAPFLLAHSRDEMLSRCTGPLEVLQHGPNGFIVCPRDLMCGGTWFAYGSVYGVICALVNVRAIFIPPWPHVESSRGELVLKVARGEVLQRSLLHLALKDSQECEIDLGQSYDPFTAVVTFLKSEIGETTADVEAFVVSNVAGLERNNPRPLNGGARVSVRRLLRGAHALSNSFIDDLSWQKVVWVREQLEISTQTANIQKFQTVNDHSSKAEDIDVRKDSFTECQDIFLECRSLLESAALILGNEKPLPTCDDCCGDKSGVKKEFKTPCFSWSPLHPNEEFIMQEYVKIPRMEHLDYGARSLTIVLLLQGHIVIAHKSYDDPGIDKTIDPIEALNCESNIIISQSQNEKAEAQKAGDDSTLLLKPATLMMTRDNQGQGRRQTASSRGSSSKAKYLPEVHKFEVWEICAFPKNS